jgi:hypothetical protein
VREVPTEGSDEQIVGEMVAREMQLAASPIFKKVILNPKIYMHFDYVVNNFGYTQDIADFLVDCVEDFLKSRGYRVVIQHEAEVPKAFMGYG